MNIKLFRLLPFVALLNFFTPNTYAQSSCFYTLIMNDAVGDGWNGGVLTVTSGAQSTPFTLSSGFADTVTFNVLDGQPLSFSWAAGQFPFQVSYRIINAAGVVVSQATAPAMPPSGVLFSGTGDCASCATPANLSVENVWDTYAWIRWSGSPSIPGIQWRVIYGLRGFNLAAGEGDTLTVSSPKITLSNLQKKTAYDVYVERNCGAVNGFSEIAGPVSFETYWTKDVGIAGIVGPVSGCDLGIDDSVRVIIKNYGAQPQTLIPFRYSVNGQEANVPKPSDGVYTGILGKDSVKVVAFETTYDFSAPGEYKIVAYTKANAQFSGDEDISNDTFTYFVNNRLITPYTQSFEEWNGGWTVSNEGAAASFEYGIPAKPSIPNAAVGQYAWVTSLTNNYNANELSYLESPCFDFRENTSDPVISFAINYDLQLGQDGAWLEMTVDSGATWNRVGAFDEGINWYNEDIAQGDAWSGNSGGWINARHLLNGAKGKSGVRVRFVFVSDASVQLGGLGIDNVRIFNSDDRDLAGSVVVVASESELCGSPSDAVTFTFVNVGYGIQNDVVVYYSVNGGPAIKDTVPTSIAPDERRSFTFDIGFDSRDALSVIKAWTALFPDDDVSNDTATVVLDHRPTPVPFQEDFESQALPQGWVSDGEVTNGHDNTSFVLAVNLNSVHTTSQHDLLRYGLIGASDSLAFSYRITNFIGGDPTTLSAGTKFEVQVSTNCAAYQTIYTIDNTNHTPSADMQTIRVSLAQFAGESINIRFRSTRTGGNFWFDIDNINLLSCAGDMALSADIKDAGAGLNNGSATVNVGLGNPPYSYNWSNGATSQTVTDLAIGNYTVTVSDSHGCSDVLEISIGLSATREIDGLSALSLRPNPSSGQVFFIAEFDRTVKDARVQVLNLLGQPVWESNNSNTALVSERIDLTQFPEGLYLLRLTVDGQVASKKLMLKR